MNESDLAFLAAFEECSLSKGCWSHEAHVRMAWLELSRQPTFADALHRIRTGIQRFNTSLGSIGYHETVTQAFTMMIHHRRLLGARDADFAAFMAANADLLARSPHALDRHYSPEALASEAARVGFVEPDRRPLPPAGFLRMASEDDAPGVRAIYAPYVEDTAVSFEVVVPSELEVRRRISEIRRAMPWIVYIADRELAGYAYGGAFRSREAYRFSAEVSVYVARRFQGRGVGRVLYTSLLCLLREQGYCGAFAGITLPNDASVRLHELLGFTPVGVYRSVGYKHGGWHDVGWWQKRLRDTESAPGPLRPPDEAGAWLVRS